MDELTTQLSTIEQLKAAMLTLPQLELETKHYWIDGVYLRWLFRPKDTVIVGKIHKKEHFYLVIQGAVQIEKTIHRAPSLIISRPGTQRAVLALEDSVCITIHRTDEHDLAKLEAELVEPDPDSPYLPGNRLPQLEQA
jgi:hypothetical protein